MIYSSTFWQILYPLTTLGFAVLPHGLVPLIKAVKELQIDGMPDFTVQLVLQRLINNGKLEKHLVYTNRLFAKRRTALIEALSRTFGSKIEIRIECSGQCLIVRFPFFPEEKILNAALAAKLPLLITDSYYMGEPTQVEFLVNFSALPEFDVPALVEKFASKLLGSI